MAKKKQSQQLQQENHQETETQQHVDQMNTLQKSKEELESEKFEKEKKEIEDQVMEEVKSEIKNRVSLNSYHFRLISNPKQKSTAKMKQPQQQHGCHHEVENPAEKMSNLKLLNEILVTKTVEYRQQINTLQNSKTELESEITKIRKFKTENKELEGKLMEVKEANQLKKMKIKEKLNEIQRLKLKFDGALQEKSELQDEINKLNISVDLLNGDLVRERELVSEIEKKFDLQVKKSNNLKLKISDLEKNQVPIQKKLSEAELEKEKLVEENKDSKKTLESVKSEKKTVEKKLTQSLKAFDDLKQDKERIVFQKENIEKNRVYQVAKIYVLEKHVQELFATIASLEKNDKMLRNRVAQEIKERDEAFQGLLYEKGLIQKKLVDLGKMVEELEQEKEEIVAEKNKIEKNKADQSVKVALENVKWRKGYTEALGKQQLLRDELHSERKKVKEIVEEKDGIEKTKMKMENDAQQLMNELGALELSLSQLDKSYSEQMDANKLLKLEVGSLNDDLKRVSAEKSEIQKELELKKKEELSLSLKVKELEKSMDDTMKEIENQKNGSELAVEMVVREKSLLEKKLVEVEKGNQCLTSKMNSAQMNGEKALLMLKDAAQIICRDEDKEKEATVESDMDMMKIEEDVQPFASELESIKKALENKDKKMEEMTQEIEKLNKSAKKNSNIWALVSSATTILAAAGVTYIAKGR
ncbi:hypothetical protein MKX03_037430 [Papaver bracteatum]|nr:hypothetical protein MKX03_037430 [Papaver bracteatum]